MATPAQAAAATVGAGSLAAAGAYGISSAVNASSSDQEESPTNELSESEKRLLNEPSSIETFEVKSGVSLDSNYTNKLVALTADYNKLLLVKPTKTNEEWWKWAFENKFPKDAKTSNDVDDLFKEVKEAYSETPKTENSKNTTLNHACDEAYKKDKTIFEEANAKLLSNIGIFCTKGMKQNDISETVSITFGSGDLDGTYTGKFLSQGDNKTKLVKPSKDNDNDLWWKWAYKNLVKGKNTNSSEVFRSVTSGHAESAANSGSNQTALNQACDVAYKKSKEEFKAVNNLLDEVATFCSPTLRKAQLTDFAG